MDNALSSKSSSSSMYTYSPASKCSSVVPHQPSLPPRHDQYEISGLSYFLRFVNTLLAAEKIGKETNKHCWNKVSRSKEL
ncbi:MAG: hypothetical protein K9M81_01965 [Chthoniobacterales bacterium]|nr:hypothetical protein [Chthoniobacterales bacterium]